jgi:glutathione synthase/RimK-type ligase-like ATP-grasp enzyme
MRPIAIFYEHPDWFRPLFAELERREIPFAKLDAATHAYDPAEGESPYDVVFNRASPSSYLRGRPQTTFHTLHWLSHLERLGVRVINGSRVFAYEISKAAQLEALTALGLPYPRSRVINHPSLAPSAARELRFPVLVKANIGGSGAGITRYDDVDAIAQAANDGAIELGVDHVGLVQELAPLREGSIYRVEVLGGKFLYAIRIFPEQGSFNLCPADVCQTTGGQSLSRAACAIDAPKNGMRVEGVSPSTKIVEAVEAIARHVQLDVGGVEYLIDDRDGLPYFYDVNALSNFVADAPRVIGFDPFARLVDFLVFEAEQAARARSARGEG